jgi:hypothetical protein
MADFEAETAPNPFVHIERIWHKAVGLEVSVFNQNIRLSNIRSLKPRQGYATQALQWLTSLADKHRVMITGTANPTDTKQPGLSKKELKAWYARHGFSVTRRGEIVYLGKEASK